MKDEHLGDDMYIDYSNEVGHIYTKLLNKIPVYCIPSSLVGVTSREDGSLIY